MQSKNYFRMLEKICVFKKGTNWAFLYYFEFKDPSIQNATKNVQITQKSLDDYNPFAQQNYQSKPAAAIIPTTTQQPQQPSPANVTNNNVQQPKPPAYVPTSAQSTTLNLSEIEKQQQELERRAAELDRREQNLNAPAGAFGKICQLKLQSKTIRINANLLF